MRKERNYKKTLRQICRNCQGSGKIVSSENPGADLKNLETCPICEGSGWINKTLDIDITIEPYHKEG